MVGAFEAAHFRLALCKGGLVAGDLALDLGRDALAHAVFRHRLELVHLLGETRDPVPDFCTLQAKLRFDFRADSRFLPAHIDEGLVAHDFLALVELTFELGGHFVQLSLSEGVEALFHVQFEFEYGLLLEQVEVRVPGQPLVA